MTPPLRRRANRNPQHSGALREQIFSQHTARGHTKGKVVQPGSVIEIDDEDEAKSLVDAGAVSVIPEATAEGTPVKTPAKK